MRIQGVQPHQVSEHMENNLYDTAGADSQSSYVSSSGIKAVLLNAWNAVKSAVSGMLSSFGLHLSEQQGSDKPGRTMTRDRVKTKQEPEARPLSPAPGPVPEDDGEHVYESIPYSNIDPGRARTEQELKARSLPPIPKPAPENVYESMPSDIDPGRARTEQEPEARPLSPAPGPVPEDDGEHVYETMPCGDINPDRAKTEQELTEQELKARPLPPIPEDSDDGSGYSVINFHDGNEISEAKSEFMELSGSTKPPVEVSDTYTDPRDNLIAGGRVEPEDLAYNSWHDENGYAISYKRRDKVSTPENDPQGESDYAVPWKSQPNE